MGQPKWFIDFSSQNKPYFEFQIYSKKNKAEAPDGMFTQDMYECEYTYRDTQSI